MTAGIGGRRAEQWGAANRAPACIQNAVIQMLRALYELTRSNNWSP